MKDLFSKQSSAYATFRPTYPKELYDFILSQVKNKNTAWDCGTGNGQVARDLKPYFKEVMATDSSLEQIKKAVVAINIFYSVAPSEHTTFPDKTFDLITVGQALHWFSFDEFYKEVRRVSKPNGILAVWGYGLLKINPAVDEIINDFYINVVGPYWDVERKHIDNHYKSIPFPFKEVPSPEFSFSFQWTLSELEGYLNTWSSVQKYITANNDNPVTRLIAGIRPLWNDEKLPINFPLFLRCAQVN